MKFRRLNLWFSFKTDNLFKLSVEMAMMMNVLAANSEIDEESLIRLRGECVKEVKRLNGSFSFDDAVDWQKGY